MTPTLVIDEFPDDLGPIIHEEIARLPERYRAPVILCDLEGRTYEEAAPLLGRPVGTIKSRLARGREHLRGRMIRRGVAPSVVASAGFLAAGSARSAAGTLSIDATARMAVQLAAGCAASDVMPPTVLTLTEGALQIMFLSQIKRVAAVILVGCGAVSLPMIRGQSSPGEPRPIAGSSEPAQADGAKPKTGAPAATIAQGPSPPGPSGLDARPATPWQTVVRIKVVGDHQTGFASGTIIASSSEESIILTSAHQFRRQERNEAATCLSGSRSTSSIRQGSVPPELNNFACCDGTLVDCDERRDIGLVRIRPGRRLPASKIVPPRWRPRAGMTMLTMGCSEGNDPTTWTTQITNPRVRGLADNDDYEGIECEFAPRQGRTGGGLFAVDHHLAGVCDFAEPQNNHGLYASPDSIYRLLDRNNLSFLYDEPAVTAAARRPAPRRRETTR